MLKLVLIDDAAPKTSRTVLIAGLTPDERVRRQALFKRVNGTFGPNLKRRPAKRRPKR